MGRLLLILSLLLFPVLESLDLYYTDDLPDLFTPYEVSNMTDIYYQLCPSKKCDNNTHVPEVELLKPSISICCYPQCSCDTSTCSKLNECCPDILNELESIPTCINAQLKPWNPSRRTGYAYYMDSKCAFPFILDEIVNKCEFSARFNELDTKVPVADSSFARIYVNRYCAICSNVDDVVPWKPIIDCTKGTFDVSPIDNIVERVRQSEYCALYFDPPDGQNQFYLYSCGPYISECNMTGKWKIYDPLLVSGCRAMFSPFQTMYRNVFCYLCNSDGNLDDMPGCFGSQRAPSSIIFELTYPVAYNVSRNETNDTACGRYGLYDPFQDSCLEIKCLLYKIYIGDGQCQRVVERMSGMNFLLFLKFTPFGDVPAVSFVLDPLLVDLEEYTETMFMEIMPDAPWFHIASGHKTTFETADSNVENKIDYFLIYYVIMLPLYNTELVNLSSIETVLTYHGQNMSLEGRGNEQVQLLIELETLDAALESDDIDPHKSFESYEYDYMTNPDKIQTLLPVHGCPVVELDLSIYNLTNGILGIMNETVSIAIGRNEYLMANNDTSILICMEVYQLFAAESAMVHKPSTNAASLKFKFSLYFVVFILRLKFVQLI